MIGVEVMPGATPFMRMPLAASSTARCSVYQMIASLEIA
jgi:hypothetical protein